MRTLRQRASLILALLTSAIAPASASELLVLPYSCIVAGGRPLLARGPEQSHQIIGRREQRTFTACSPVNRDMCRTWTVHRFDLDCDGTRVPWTEVVASANHDRRSSRAWLDDGRLIVRMPPSWSFEEDDPCARRSRVFEGFGRMRRYCEERRSMAPPPVVAMPAGFAPMLGIDGYFVTSAPSVSAAPPLPTTPPVIAAPEPAPPPKIARAEPSDPPRPELVVPKVQEAAPKPPPASAPAPKVSAPTPPAPKPAVRPAPPAEGDAIVPKVINRNDTVASAPPPPPAEKVAPQREALTTGTISKSDQPVAPESSPERPSSPPSLLTFSAISPATGVFAAFMVLTTALLVLFFMARRREQLQAEGRPQDVAAAQLYARPKAAPRASGAVAVTQARPSPQPVRYTQPAVSASIPRTRSEAIEILGMGVMPDANLAAIKKIVDGLRQSWHPDLARDEADRALREQRMKQINAAWDIIAGRRSEV